MRFCLSLALIPLIASTLAFADCREDKSELLFEYVSTPPLLATDPDASTIVQVDAAGCAVVHFPAQSLYRGDYRLLLTTAEVSQLTAKLESAALHRIDPAAFDQRLKAMDSRKSRSEPLVAIRDENLIQFRVPGAANKQNGRAALRLTGLRQALANHPQDEGLIALKKLEASAEALAEKTRRLGKKVQP